jgi:hypothetical protein
MFGKKDKKPHIVGAKEKYDMAMALKHGTPDEIESKREGKGTPDITAPIVLICGMAMVLATLLTQGVLSKGGLPFSLPDPWLHTLLLGKNPARLTGDADMDVTLAIIIRGFAIFLLAGVVPGIIRAVMFMMRIEKPRLYAFWLCSIVLMAVALVFLVL